MNGAHAILAVATALAVTACSNAGARETRPERAADRPGAAGIYQLQADIHASATSKDLDLLMSRWDDGASLVVAGRTYVGKGEIRRFFATSHPAFRPDNRWVALTRSSAIEVTTEHDHGALYFECYFVDVDTRQVVSATSATTKVVRRSGRWLLTEYRSGTVELAP
jgi:hypothetical protein